MIVEMLATAAGPEFILEKHKFYNVSRKLGEQLCATNPDWPQDTYALPAPNCPREKLTPIPQNPDPEDKGVWGADEGGDDE
jgi:hypothetical protein